MRISTSAEGHRQTPRHFPSNVSQKVVGELDETRLIAELQKIFRPAVKDSASSASDPTPKVELGIGDDAAVLVTSDKRYVTSTDMMVAGLDWRDQWSSAYEVGMRLAAQNLADIAAMGAKPTALTLNLGLPEQTPVAWILDFAAGLQSRLESAGATVVGGDLSGCDRVIVSASVFGDLAGMAPVTRRGAKIGDIVALAGTLGHSYCGLDFCRAGYAHLGHTLPTQIRRRASSAIQIFKAAMPPLSAGPKANRGGANAMLDLSDGLVKDASRIAAASAVTLQLDPAQLEPEIEILRPCAEFLGKDPLDWVLSGGEDHSLLACFPADTELPAEFRPLGRVIACGDAPVLYGKQPAPMQIDWDHFADAPAETN